MAFAAIIIMASCSFLSILLVLIFWETLESFLGRRKTSKLPNIRIEVLLSLIPDKDPLLLNFLN